MVYVRSHKFCCCLPVRFGVFVMSIGTLLLSGFLAVSAGILIHNDMTGQMKQTQSVKTAAWIILVFDAIVALTSIFGFVGCLSRKRALVATYATISWILFVLNVASGAFSLYRLFHQDNSDVVNNCVQSINDKTGTNADVTNTVCKDGVTVVSDAVKAVVVTVQIIYWLIQLYGCHIISSYVSQLHEEEEAENRSAPPPTMVMNAGPQPTYYPFASENNSYGKSQA